MDAEGQNKKALLILGQGLNSNRKKLSLLQPMFWPQVVFRYGFHHSFSWTEEVSRFFIVWMTFGGSAYAFRKGAHMGVEALVQKLSPRGQFIMLIFSRVSTIVFFLFLGYFGLQHTVQQYLNHQLAPSTRLPIAIPYSALPIGSVLVILRLVDQMIHELKTGTKEA